MFGRLKLVLISALFVLLCMQVSLADAAKGGLQLVSVTLVGGGGVPDAADIPTEPQFDVLFDKNVVSSVVWEKNSTCFSLVSTDNESIPVNVTRVDDTTDFTKRQNIFVQPVNPLRPGTAYYLKISPEIRAKNGATLGKEAVISFKTLGEAPIQATQPTEQPSKDQTCTADKPAIKTDCVQEQQ